VAKKAAEKKAAPKYPSARAGNYRAQVDTAGMDPEMKRTLEIGKRKKKGRG
jgi:hypothetical protein